MLGSWDIKLHNIYRSLDHFELIKEDVQHKLKNKYSAAVIQEGLKSCIAIKLEDEMYKVGANSKMQSINKELGIRWDKSVISKAEFKKYKPN